jgi:hypothetical protein
MGPKVDETKRHALMRRLISKYLINQAATRRQDLLDPV